MNNKTRLFQLFFIYLLRSAPFWYMLFIERSPPEAALSFGPRTGISGGYVMIFRFQLYKKPFSVSAVLFFLGLGMIAGGIFLSEYTVSMDYYGMAAGGLLVFITGIVVYAVYGKLEKQYQNMLRNGPLLRFTVESRYLKQIIDKNIEDIRSQNKALLFVMLFFCVLVAVVMPFFFEYGYLFIFIGIGLGAFLSAAAFVITSYRVAKQRNGKNEFILTRQSAYANGEFHSWNMPGTSLTEVKYVAPDPKKDRPGRLELTYLAVSYPAPLEQKVNIPVPAEFECDIPGVMQALREQIP